MKTILTILLLLSTVAYSQTPIFSWKAGSYQDLATGSFGTNSGTTFEVTDKGLAGYHNRNHYHYYTFAFSGDVLAYIIWFKPQKTPDTAPHIICGNGYTNRVSYITATGAISVYVSGSGGSGTLTSAIVNFNQWNFCYVLFEDDGANYDYTIYLNGDTYTGTVNSYNLSTMSSLYIGRWDGASWYGIIGNIKTVRAYNRALSTQERNNLYAEFQRATIIRETKRPSYTDTYPKDLSNESGLVCAYNMRPQGTSLIDISGNGNTGTLTDGMATIDGLVFNGSSTKIINSTLEATGGQYTFLYRCKSEDAVATKYLTDIESGRLIIAWNGSSAFPSFYDGSWHALSSNNIRDNNWHNLAFVFDVDTCNFYLNGEWEGGSTFTSKDIDDDIGIGTNYAGNGNYFDGEIADIRIYNRILSSNEIIDYHNSWVDVKLKDTYEFDGVGNVPDYLIVNSGTFAVNEDATGKYLDCTGNGTVSYTVDLGDYYENGWIEILTGDLSGDEGGTVSDATNLSWSEGRLTITMTSGQKLREIVITNAERQ